MLYPQQDCYYGNSSSSNSSCGVNKASDVTTTFVRDTWTIPHDQSVPHSVIHSVPLSGQQTQKDDLLHVLVDFSVYNADSSIHQAEDEIGEHQAEREESPTDSTAEGVAELRCIRSGILLSAADGCQSPNPLIAVGNYIFDRSVIRTVYVWYMYGICMIFYGCMVNL